MKLIRVFALSLAIGAAMFGSVPTAQALPGCPIVEVSYDGGQTWSECHNWGRVESGGTTTCYYSC